MGVVGDQQVNKSCLLMWRLPLAYIYPRQHYWARAVLAVVRPRTRMAQVKNRIGDQAKKMHADQTKSIEAGQLPQFKKRFITNLIFAGCFMLYNTGKEAVTSTHGLLTTVAYQVTKKQ